VPQTALPLKPAALSSPLSLSGKLDTLNHQIGNTFASCSMYALAQSNQLGSTAPIPALCAATCTTALPVACITDLKHILYIHSTPYNGHALQQALSLCNLSKKFPNLVHDITYSSPIGNPPLLSCTFLPPNLSSANIHPNLIDLELASEVTTSRMSGPFSPVEATIIFGSFYHSSLVGLVKKVPSDNVWCMIWHLSKREEDGQSTNDWLDSDDFPTSYFTASWVAQFVSFCASLALSCQDCAPSLSCPFSHASPVPLLPASPAHSHVF